MKSRSNKVKISVRNLVEFILRSGDLNTTTGNRIELDAMKAGANIHKKIQKRMGSFYQAEVPLFVQLPFEIEEDSLILTVEGRADGILKQVLEQGKESIIVDEIKGSYRELTEIKEPDPIHLAQVLCYAYMYSKQERLDNIEVRLTYCNLETEEIKYFSKIQSFLELEAWFLQVIEQYKKWVIFQYKWKRLRNQSIKQLQFPFSYREGQKKLVEGVYRTILRNKKLFIEAPTGVGKTISTIFPSVKAIGEEKAQKLFYLTAKTITRTIAEETIQILLEQKVYLKVLTITAKEKLCILEKVNCNPQECIRAKGHFDRVNDAIFELLAKETFISRDLIQQYAQMYTICPFEFSLDIANWVDIIICDYNYVFDPKICLKRFLSNDKKGDSIFLIDEAHNLVDRARELYSATLFKKSFLQMRKRVKGKYKKLEQYLSLCNKELLQLKRVCEQFELVDNITLFVFYLTRVMDLMEKYLKEESGAEEKQEALQFYFDIQTFLNSYDLFDENYEIYTNYEEQKGFRLRLQCMNPAFNLQRCLNKGKSSIFFSATLLPIQYYKEQLGGTKEDYAIYIESPFKKKNRLVLIAHNVSTKYTRRTKEEYKKISQYIVAFVCKKIGNYLVFFPSYSILQEVVFLLKEVLCQKATLIIQRNNMTEQEKEEFLEQFREKGKQIKLGCCVLGGMFSEGIDLKKDQLIGAAIVGTGLPMVCTEREALAQYYKRENTKGFEYAYLYPGINKVLQAAGRVIRTEEDKGVILLLDERLHQKQYQQLFPKEWFPYETVSITKMEQRLEQFWKEVD